MKAKTILSLVLLAFVAVSVVFIVAKEARRSAAASAQVATVPAAPAAAAVPATPMCATAAAAATNTADDAKPPKHQVLAYYLHNNTRCPSCIKIEKYTTAAINKYFADELQSGALVFQVLNYEDQGNEHFATDYELVTKSVIIADMHDGVQTRWANLEDVWNLLGDEKKFGKYIQKNVKDYLNEKK
jgi:hypothetical protein